MRMTELQKRGSKRVKVHIHWQTMGTFTERKNTKTNQVQNEYKSREQQDQYTKCELLQPAETDKQ